MKMVIETEDFNDLRGRLQSSEQLNKELLQTLNSCIDVYAGVCAIYGLDVTANPVFVKAKIQLESNKDILNG